MSSNNNFNSIEKRSVWFYTKLFFIMLIPVVGLLFTAYLAFTDKEDTEIRRLARGALIVRILAVIVVCIILSTIFVLILPNISTWIRNISIFLLRLI